MNHSHQPRSCGESNLFPLLPEPKLGAVRQSTLGLGSSGIRRRIGLLPRAGRAAEGGLVRGVEVALLDDLGARVMQAQLLTRDLDEVAARVAPVDTEFLDAGDLGGAVAALVEVGDVVRRA